MPKSLDFSWVNGRRQQRRRRLYAVLTVLCAAAVYCGGQLAAYAVRLPGWVDRTLAEHFVPGYEGRLAALQQENRSLRAGLAAALPFEEENTALRELLACGRVEETLAYLPCTVTGLGPSGFTVDRSLPSGAALVDACGRLLGCVTQQGERSAEAALLGGPGCRAVCTVGGAVGTVVRQNGGLWLTGLPRGCAAQPGDPVVTLASESCPAGLWVGQLREAPVLSQDCLTALAPLEDTAALPAGACFAVQPVSDKRRIAKTAGLRYNLGRQSPPAAVPAKGR